MVILQRGDARLVGYDRGEGLPVVFQHGLGSALDQVDETLVDLPGLRRLSLECRAHGASGAGTERPFSLAMFEADVLAFADSRAVGRFVAGGISMGAALALRLAVHHPARVRALLLVRPAWLFDGAPPGLAGHRALAATLRAAPHAMVRGTLARTAGHLARSATASPALLRWIERHDPVVAADVLDDIARDALGVTAEAVATLRVPTLVIGHAGDPLHPMLAARTLAALVPGATFVTVPPKDAPTKTAHLEAIEAAVTGFLSRLVDQPD